MALPKELYDLSTGERKYLNKEERKAFFNATLLEEASLKYYCQFLYYTGCRLSEALEINPDRLDYADKGAIIRTLKQGKDKNGQDIIRYRFNELPESYLHELQGVYKILQKKESKKKKDKLPLWQFTDRSARTYVGDVMAKAGIEGKKATSRGLRHSMGVMLALNKVPVTTIQKVLGHKAVQNTLIYLEVVEQERRGLISQVW